ncbi:hypothetical protein FOMPIDRAFT_62396, partial [Fomitopsis schrenkii]
TAVYIFDRFLTFNSEVEHIWRRKKSAITWVYVSMHVCTLLLFVTNVAGWLDQGTCVVSVQSSLSLAEFISAARAYTINGCRWPIPAFTFLMSLVPVATNIVGWDSLGRTYILAVSEEVDLQLYFAVEIASRTCVIAVDLIVLLVTWRATYGMHKSAHSLKIESSIASALLRDGTY